MRYESLDDIYSANARFHQEFKATLGGLDETRARQPIEDEKWTIAQVAEHIAMVEDGVFRICNKLLGEAREAGREAGGSICFSANFFAKGAEIAEIKLEAPDRVQPVGTATIAESIARLDDIESRLAELRPLLENFDCSRHTFPHPYMGALTAVEWLTLAGMHKGRHTRQIEKLKAKLQ